MKLLLRIKKKAAQKNLDDANKAVLVAETVLDEAQKQINTCTIDLKEVYDATDTLKDLKNRIDTCGDSVEFTNPLKNEMPEDNSDVNIDDLTKIALEAQKTLEDEKNRAEAKSIADSKAFIDANVAQDAKIAADAKAKAEAELLAKSDAATKTAMEAKQNADAASKAESDAKMAEKKLLQQVLLKLLPIPKMTLSLKYKHKKS